jgi:hypothetical protein
MQTYNLFGSPIYKTKIDPLSYDKETLVKTMQANYAINPIRNKWNNISNLHHTYLDWDNPEFLPIDHSSLIPVYEKQINEFMKTIRFRKDVSYIWDVANFAVNTIDMAQHDHLEKTDTTMNMFSCTHYISYDKSAHGTTEFTNGLPLAYYTSMCKPYQDLLDPRTADNSAYFETWAIDTDEDDFVIFPSYLKHAVYPTKIKTDHPRIVGVVNIGINLK